MIIQDKNIRSCRVAFVNSICLKNVNSINNVICRGIHECHNQPIFMPPVNLFGDKLTYLFGSYSVVWFLFIV